MLFPESLPFLPAAAALSPRVPECSVPLFKAEATTHFVQAGGSSVYL